MMRQKSKGFTLVELIVVMAVFLLVIGAALVIFISVVQHQRKILSEQELLNQVSYAQEYMSKALRMAKAATRDEDASCLDGNIGYIYLLRRPDSKTGLYRGIKFINQSDNNACQEFFLDNETDPAHPVLKELKNSANDSDAVALTSASLQIEFVRFGINGSNGCYGGSACPDGISDADDLQPRVTILLGVKTRGSEQEPARIIQTTVSQRNLNVK